MFQHPRRAFAQVHGLDGNGQIRGMVDFFPAGDGSWVRADIQGLPSADGFFAFHIHEGSSCANPQGHYNPQGKLHPNHAGDLPPLLSNDGHAFTIFRTDRFSVEEIIGKTVIIHAHPDDFTTQPSGNPGPMIACGEIVGIPVILKK